jgi:HD-GYP domain-containing protein (c-di-GMP phosphodiesterase class II)
VRSRAGKAFDPVIATLLADEAPDILTVSTGRSVWDDTLAAEPTAPLVLRGPAVDEALAAIGDFTDLVSPYLVGHSSGVAALASDAAERLGLGAADVLGLRRAGLLHDLGRVAVPAGLWQKPGPLTADEWERVRLHAYHTERVLSRAPELAGIAVSCGRHHERLDGSGYHRACGSAELPPASRVLAAADAFHAMTEPRPHRAPLTTAEATGALVADSEHGRLDVNAVGSVLEAAVSASPTSRGRRA